MVRGLAEELGDTGFGDLMALTKELKFFNESLKLRGPGLFEPLELFGISGGLLVNEMRVFRVLRNTAGGGKRADDRIAPLLSV